MAICQAGPLEAGVRLAWKATSYVPGSWGTFLGMGLRSNLPQS